MPLDPQTFFGVPYRTVVTTLSGRTLTLLDHLASSRQIEIALGAPTRITGKVPSFDPQVNIPHTDGEAFVGYSDRQIYMLRREGTDLDPPVWVPRACGLIQPLQDDGNTDDATSSYTAFDPWQVLYQRPVIVSDGSLVPADGWTIYTLDAAQIVQTLLDNMATYITLQGDPYPEAFLDWGTAQSYSGGAYYTGTMDFGNLPTLTDGVEFGQGLSVGEAFDQLMEAGYCEIVIEPIYDVANRPGCLGQVSVYFRAGQTRNTAIFAWDKPGRSVSDISPLYDGGQLLNKARYRADQGGPAPVVAVNAASVARYGPYWEQKFYGFSGVQVFVDTLAAEQVDMRKYGKRTLTISPMTARSPIPFVEYNLGDSVPVYASSNLRQPIEPTLSSGEWVDIPRIYGITVELDDNDVERVSQLTVNWDETN